MSVWDVSVILGCLIRFHIRRFVSTAVFFIMIEAYRRLFNPSKDFFENIPNE